MGSESTGQNHERISNYAMVLTSLCAGAIAGAIAKSSIAPLDRTKINFQISSDIYTTRKAWMFLVHTFQTEGFIALWRGNSATMARIIPYAAIQFTAHEQWKRVLNIDYTMNSPVKQLLAGSLAGITSQSLTYPLDLARARMAVTPKDEYSSLKQVVNAGMLLLAVVTFSMLQVFIKISRDEGVFTFYRGYVPTIIGVIPYAGVSFYTYDTLKRLYRENISDRKLGTVPSLLFGAAAGVCGQTSSYPLDIVRRRMQTDVSSKYKTIVGTLKYIHRNEGFRGFYKGLSMNWIKGPIAVGISFATYDSSKNFLNMYVIGARTQH